MHVTLTDVKNGEPVYLTRSLSGGLEVALCEFTYYHKWYNIRGVGRVSNEHTAVLVPDGYYNACNRSREEDSFTLSSCLMGSTKEKSSPPLRGLGR